MPRATRWARVCLCAAVAAAVLATGAAAQGGRYSLQDRVILGDFTRITAVAASSDRLFVASETAVITWNPLERRWSGPWQPPQPGILIDVLAGLADPLGGGFWMVNPGGWTYFEPVGELWESGTVPGRVIDAALDEAAPGAGLFLRTPSGWYLATRGGVAMPSAAPSRPRRPASPAEASRSNPAIQATSAGLSFISRMRSVRFTAAAHAEGFLGTGWYIGTFGAGLLYYAEAAGVPEQLAFGLPRGPAGAVFAGTGGVWVITERTADADPALTFVGKELTEFRWWQGPRATGLPFAQGRRMVGRGEDLWVATDVGLVRLTPRSEDSRRYDMGSGLPDSRIADLSQRRGRLAIATAHGIASWTDTAGFERLAPMFTSPADAVAISGDTTWVGTRLGLFAALPGEPDLLQPDALREGLSLQAAVVDLAWLADTLVALTPDRLLWRDPRTGRFTLGPALGGGLGRLHTLVAGERGVYVAGEQGVGFATLPTPIVRALTVPSDLPAIVRDIAVDPPYLWVATARGLVRLSLDLVGQ